MKIRVTYTVEVSDIERRGISARYKGHDRPCTRKEAQDYLQEVGASGLDDLEDELNDFRFRKTKQ